MGRKLNPETKNQHIIRVDNETYVTVTEFKHEGETIHHAMKRLIRYLKPHEELISENEQLKRTLAAMQRDLLNKQMVLE
jgi:hypothetical protein